MRVTIIIGKNIHFRKTEGRTSEGLEGRTWEGLKGENGRGKLIK